MGAWISLCAAIKFHLVTWLSCGTYSAQIVGQPILAAAGFQPAFAERKCPFWPEKAA
jgi:hypothetical protein